MRVTLLGLGEWLLWLSLMVGLIELWRWPGLPPAPREDE